MTDQKRFAPLFRALIVLLIACGAIARVVPLMDQEGRLLEQYPSEDGYLMLTIARNIALGHGMSTAEGTIPTNGTQPLVNFLWAIGFFVLGGAKKAGVLFALICQVVFSGVAARQLYLLSRRLTTRHQRSAELSALAAAGWYATMLSCMHGMNCLETGAYALGVIAFLRYLTSRDEDPLARWSFRRALTLGVALGVVFWIRIDTVFLILGACLTRAVLVEEGRFRIELRNVTSAVVMGLTTIVVASPWLAYNQLQFGSVMPISGTAQSWAAGFGQNLTQAIANLAEYVLVVLPIPQPIEKHPAVNAICAAVLLFAIGLLVREWRQTDGRVRAALATFGVFTICLFAYYGLFFGAPHFVGRYLYPASPFLAILWAAVICSAWDRFTWLRAKPVSVLAGCMLIAVTVYPNVRLYGKGSRHQHFQVVEWVDENVADDVWGGAVQTGPLGFFHDRTINLDGKVNPEALEAALARQIPQYVLDRNLQYLADWKGIAQWVEDYPEIRDNFDLVVHDEEENLAILRRKTRFAAGAKQ